MSEFTCLLGEPALSDFRRRKLARRIAAVTGAEPAIDARFVYLIETASEPPADELSALEDLLFANGGFDQETGSRTISLNARLRFFGRTLSGKAVESGPAYFTLDMVP